MAKLDTIYEYDDEQYTYYVGHNRVILSVRHEDDPTGVARDMLGALDIMVIEVGNVGSILKGLYVQENPHDKEANWMGDASAYLEKAFALGSIPKPGTVSQGGVMAP